MTALAALGVLLAPAFATNLTGVVTFERDSLPFCFVVDTEGHSWRVPRPEGMDVSPGDVLSVSGEREPSVKRRIDSASVTVAGRDVAAIPPPEELGITQLFDSIMPYGNADMYGRSFTTEGIVRDINRRQTTTQLLVAEDDWSLQVEMPYPLEESLPDKLRIGARVRVTGALAWTSIENYEEGIYGRIENVELIPMSKDDIVVVRRAPRPPYWTSRRVASAFSVFAVVFAVLFAWAWTLRRMVAKKTRELAESIRARETARIEADASRRERLRLAADLHDGFQQYLAGAMFRLKAARNYLPPDAARSREQLDRVHEALQHTQNGLRATLWAMNEESEGPESLTGLLGFVARRMAHWEGKVSITSEGTERSVARNFCGSLLLVVQEAVGNALKHGKAEHVEVKTVFAGKQIVLSVTDDGCGFDAEAVRGGGHYGLGTMERRVRELGGTMTVESAPGRGARFVFAIPA